LSLGPLVDVLSAFRTPDPVAWLAAAARLPWPVAALAAVVGAFLVAAGGGRAFRILAAPLGALLGLLGGEALAGPLGLLGNETALAVGAATVLFVMGALAPSVLVAIAYGVPVGLAFGGLVGKTGFLLGFIPAALLAGAVAAVLHRPLRVLLAAAAGATLLLLGLLGLLHRVPAVAEFQRTHAVWLLAVAGAVAFAGAVVQLAAWMHPGNGGRARTDAAPPGALHRGAG
jgi:hypothetical protein